MENKYYGLNIDDEYVRLFSKNLGFGNPLDSEYWFLGNEEMLDPDKNETKSKNKIINNKLDSDKNETKSKNKIINNKLDSDKGNLFNTNGFFTKKFSACQNMNKLWKGYEYIKNNFGELDSHFIGEFYFLPGKTGSKLGNLYGTNEKNRQDFYKNNNLEELLKERLDYMLGILNICFGKEVYIYID